MEKYLIIILSILLVFFIRWVILLNTTITEERSKNKILQKEITDISQKLKFEKEEVQKIKQIQWKFLEKYDSNIVWYLNPNNKTNSQLVQNYFSAMDDYVKYLKNHILILKNGKNEN